MSSRYFAPAVNELTKITLRGRAIVKALVNYPINDSRPSTPYGAPSYEPSSDRWSVRFGYLVFELDPASADSVNKTADALTDGNLGTSVSYTLTGPGWVNVGPTIDMGDVGTYLYLVKYDVAGLPPPIANPPVMSLIAYPPAAGDTVISSRLELAYVYDGDPHDPYTFGALVRGKRSFQLQFNPVKLNPTDPDVLLTVYEISVFRV
jgi:hypothetical protein